MTDFVATSPESTALAKELKRRGVRFVGPVADLVRERDLLVEAGLDYALYCELCRALGGRGAP